MRIQGISYLESVIGGVIFVMWFIMEVVVFIMVVMVVIMFVIMVIFITTINAINLGNHFYIV